MRLRLPFYIFFAFCVSSSLLPALLASCSGEASSASSSSSSSSAAASADAEDFEAALRLVDDYLADTVAANRRWEALDSMPGDAMVRLRARSDFYGDITRFFNDSNRYQYAAAERLGIVPFDIDSAATPWPRRPLERIHPTEHFAMDRLTHSYPFLVPEAHALLDDIARSFHDSLAARGGGDYRLKLTSFLRTRGSVARLRRVNTASVDSSAHLFGTTFDISFNQFPYTPGNSPHRSQADLKALLAEILDGYRAEGRCYVMYEHGPGCFHITTRR